MQNEKLDGHVNKERMISVRVTDADYDKINAFAAQFSLAVGTYLRMVGLLGHLPFVIPKGSAEAVPGVVRVKGIEEKAIRVERASERRKVRVRAAS